MADLGEGFRQELNRQDPSALTTSMLLRELTSLSAIMTERIDAIHVRLDAMDKAQALFHENLTRVPTETDKSISQLKELHSSVFRERFGTVAQQFETVEERFRTIDLQFRERDERVKQTAQDTKTAVDAALQAAEKAVGKQNESNAVANNKAEEGFTKQIDQQRLLLETTTRGLNDKIDDVKSRLNMIEGRGSGAASSWGVIVAVLGILGMLGGVVIALVR